MSMVTKVDIKLRTIEPHDIDKLFEWRNHPDVRSKSFNTAPIAWDEHKKWFNDKLQDQKVVIYIAFDGNNKIGSIRFEDKGNAVKVSVMLNPDFSGKGLGALVIKLGTEKFINRKKPNKPIIAEIKKDNIASIKAFQKAGFEERYLTLIYSL